VAQAAVVIAQPPATPQHHSPSLLTTPSQLLITFSQRVTFLFLFLSPHLLDTPVSPTYTIMAQDPRALLQKVRSLTPPPPWSWLDEQRQALFDLC
jgi:hypothetical protein